MEKRGDDIQVGEQQMPMWETRKEPSRSRMSAGGQRERRLACQSRQLGLEWSNKALDGGMGPEKEVLQVSPHWLPHRASLSLPLASTHEVPPPLMPPRLTLPSALIHTQNLPSPRSLLYGFGSQTGLEQVT